MKSNQKCVRLTDQTLQYIESFDGNGFNQKLENMTDYFMLKEELLKKRVINLEAEEQHLIERIAELRTMERNLSAIKNYLESAKRLTDKAPLSGQMKIS